MLSRTKCLSIALVFGIVSQSLSFSKPATASVPSAASLRPAAISPLSSPLGAPETLTPTATVSDTISTLNATTPTTESTAVAASGKTSHLAVQVDFETQTVRQGQTVHGSLYAQWQGVKSADLAPTAPFTAEVVFPAGLDYAEGSSSGQYDPAQRRLFWHDLALDSQGQAMLPFVATVNGADTPQRLSLRPSAASTQAVRVTTQRSQLRVMQAAPAQKISAKTGGTFQTSSGHVRLDFSQDSFPGATLVITGDEGPLVAPSEILPEAQPQTWKALASAARQQSFNAEADPEQTLEQDITRLSLADPLLKVDFYPSMVFSRPVTATFELGAQIAQELAASGLTPVLQYAIETPFTSTYQVSPTLSVVVTNTRRTFEELPSWYDPDTGRLTAFIGHFSTYEVNVSDLPKPWRLAPSLGEIDPLRGSYGYQYPIQVPAMQDGLAPSLDLRYSSSKGDADSTIEPFGHGWSIELPKVMRKLRQTAEVTTNYYPIEQGPDNGHCPNPVNNGWCWYVVGSYSTVSGYHLDYEDKFTLSFGGQDHYLVQKSAGSNEYVTLNYTPLRIYRCSNTLSCGSNAVSNSNASGEYWQVWTPDGVRYVFGTDTASEVRLNGTSPAATVTQAWYLKSVFAPYRDDATPAVNRASVQYFYTQKTDAGGAYQTNLTRVEYGNRLRPDGTTASAQYSVTLQYVDRTARLSQPLTITVRAEGNVTRQYQLGYDGHSGSDGNEAQNLSRIQEIAPNGATLPAVTFTYIYTQSRAFISQMSNGYGASAQLSYEFARGGFRMRTSQHTDTATNWKDYNYYIYYDETITDTQHPTGYSPCFDWLMNDAITGEPLCRVGGYDYSISGTYRLLGYPIVEVQVRNPDNPAEWLGVTKHSYKFETWRLGQEFRVRQEGGVSAIPNAPSEPALAESWVTQTKQLTTGMPVATGVIFGAASEKVEIPDVNHPERYKRTTYAYDPASQGGTQYGQTTGVWEYDSATLVRRHASSYAMNTTTWTLGKTTEQLYDGTGNWASEQRLYYNPQGRVTFTQVLKDVSGSTTQDVAITYDALGNVASQTTFTATGSVGILNANGRSGATTTYGYDAAFGYYVITLTNSLAYATRYTFYGVNEASPTAGQPFGSLASVRDPNGNQTAYAYDPFGRLNKVAKPGDTLTNPSEAYQYYDGVNTGDGTLSQTVGITAGAANPLLVMHLTYGGTGTHFANSGVAAWERTFYDGLGRVIETQTSAVGQDKVAYTLYNSEGQAYAQSVAYLVTPYTYATSVVNGVTKVVNPYRVPDLSQQRNATQYDVQGRVVGSTSADGSTATTSYAIGADTNGAQTTLTTDPLYHRRVSVSDMLGRVTAVREYTTTPWVNEMENYAGVDSKFLDHKTTTAVVSKPAPFSVDRTENFIYGPGYTVTVAGPGQVLLFRLAIDSASGPDAYVGNIQVYAHTSASQGHIVAIRWIRRSEFRGGLTNFSEFALPFDTTGLQGAVLEYTFWWAGNAQMAVDRTTVYWTNTPSQVTQYHYDVRDNLTAVTDALNNTTVITYDGFGRKVGMRDVDMGVWAYSYDAVGNLTTQTDAKGQALWFGYDKLNRQTEKRIGDNTGTLLAQYTYDQGTNGIGHRTSTSNANAATSWTYDIRGRVGAEEMSFTGVTGTFGSAIQYDSLDRPIWQRLPNGEMVTTGYDAAGQATSLSAGGQGLVTGATYNALGQPSVITYGNTLKARYLYFGLDIPTAVDGHDSTYMYGWLRRICVLPQSSNIDCEGEALTASSPLLNLGYNYDANQNVTVIRDDSKHQRELFQYDALDRLTLAYPNNLTTTTTISDYYQSYAYDAIGNFTNFSGTLYTNDAAHKHAVAYLDGVQRYWYDANGNMTVRVEKGVVYTQTWDVENRLVEVISGTQHTQYFYDADGQRVKRITPQGTTLYVGADYEVTGPSQMVTPTYAHKLYFPIMACANCSGVPAVNPPPLNVATARVTYRFNGQPVAVREGNTLTFVHGDHLGSTNLTTNLSGTRVSELRYYPFGETRYSNGTTPTSKRFNAKEQQTDIGLYDYGARFFDPALGRFVSADNIVPRWNDPQSLNRYAYVQNSPVTRVDPSGHSDICNAYLYNCGISPVNDHSTTDPYLTAPSPNVVASVANGSPYPLLDANVTNPNQLNTLAERWITTHPYYNFATDPNLISTDAFGGRTTNLMFPYVQAALIRVLLAHGLIEEAKAVQGASVEALISLTGAGIYAAGTIIQSGQKGEVAVALPSGRTLNDGMTQSSDEALDAAIEFLGPGYTEEEPGRFRSADGTRQVRMLDVDLASTRNHSGAPHVNFEGLEPIPQNPGRYKIYYNIHVFITNP